MSVTEFHGAQQKRALVLTRTADAWRVSIIPPPGAEPEIPRFDDFDHPDEALGYGARLAYRTGWQLVDLTGRRSIAELSEAIHEAGALKY